MQPTQLSLLPDQVPAPPSDLASQLPAPLRAEAAAVLARMITQAVRAIAAGDAPAICLQQVVNHGE